MMMTKRWKKIPWGEVINGQNNLLLKVSTKVDHSCQLVSLVRLSFWNGVPKMVVDRCRKTTQRCGAENTSLQSGKSVEHKFVDGI